MSNNPSIKKFENWLDQYLNFEKTPKKNIFWLETMKFFCEKFGHPESFAPCFHVAGSKGKGSISAFITSILDEAGFKTGLYTSPHILDFIERVSSAHGSFEDSVYEKAVDEMMNLVSEIHSDQLPGERPITWFELVTIFGFLVFRQAKVDYSVYEVGLGGRLDSTNVVNPLCACIGPIELEHTEFLGDTIEKIAAEKGGIIKENGTVVIARQKPNVRKVFEEIAREKHATAIFVEDEIENLKYEIENISKCIKNNTSLEKNTITTSNLIKNSLLFHTSYEKFNKIPGMRISFNSKIFTRQISCTIQMAGKFQAENAALAALAVKKAIPSITEEQIEKGLSKAKLPARFEIINSPNGFKNIPYLILDGAHTVNSVTFTMETMKSIFGDSTDSVFDFNLLFGCAADKDSKDIALLFKNYFSSVMLTKPGAVKACDISALKNAFDEAQIKYDCNEDFTYQIENALKKADETKSILLVTGSFYLVSEVKKFLM